MMSKGETVREATGLRVEEKVEDFGGDCCWCGGTDGS